MRRSPAAWLLGWRALRVVVWVRWSLWRRPYATVRADLRRRHLPSEFRASSGERTLAGDPRALAWAVRAAARRVPRASCLTQSLALEALLAQAGHRSTLRIGVARKNDGTFEAHAWVESEGRVLIGRIPNLQRFAPLPPGSTDRLDLD